MEPRVNNNQLFPVFFKLNQLNVLVVGGGTVGLEKLKAILNNSPLCNITIVAKEFNKELESFILNFPNVSKQVKSFTEDDVKGFNLVIGAVNDSNLSTKIQAACKKENILCNLADKPHLCDFYLGSIVTKGDIKIAISTNGKSPTLAKRIKEILNEAINDDIFEVLENLVEIRASIKGDIQKKIRILNQATNAYKLKTQDTSLRNRIFKTSYISAGVIFVMILGHLIFSYVPFNQLGEMLKSTIKPELGLYILGGIMAQCIDGALGMAYGVSVTTFLMSLGIPSITPAVASASMHASEVFTSGASSLVYMRYKNINKKMFKVLVSPGIIGAIAGAFCVSYFGKNYFHLLKPVVSFYTFLLGIIIIFKAINFKLLKHKLKSIIPVALLGGFLDSVGGGGWGPIVTGSLLAGGRNLRYVIGSSHLAKFFVALASTISFCILIGIGHWPIIFGLVIGGMIAAPFSIYLSTKIPTRKGLVLVGTVIILISLRNIFKAFI